MPPSDTQFENLRKRVKALEDAPPSSAAASSGAPSWTQRHQVLTWLIGLTIPAVALVVAIYAGVIPHIEKDDASEIKNQVSEGLKQPLQKIGSMSDDIAEIKGTLQAWAPLMTQQFFKRAASLPEKQFRESLSQVSAVAHVAGETKSEVPVEDLSDIGKRTLALASGNSESASLAWKATVALVQYRSAINGVSTPANVAAATTPYQTKYHLASAPGYEMPSFKSSLPPVPREESAAADFIGRDENRDQPTGPATLFVLGGGITLDNLHLKNVTLVNTHIVYSGGAVQLENVQFLNCTFELTSTNNTRQLAEHILTYPSISLSVS